MTAQIREVLYYNWEKYYLSTEPLRPLLEIIGDIGNEKSSSVVWMSTDCKRGYIGTWEIIEDKLSLIGLEGCPEKNEKFPWIFYFQIKKKYLLGGLPEKYRFRKGKYLYMMMQQHFTKKIGIWNLIKVF